MQLQQYIRRSIQRLSPYASLCLLAVPLMLAEPLKMVAIFTFGSGHWLAGLGVMLCAYLVSVLLVERLFKIVKPKLLTLSWFVTGWKKFIAARGTALRWLKSKWLREPHQTSATVSPKGVAASARGKSIESLARRAPG
jgi:hypothetical protein